MELLGTVQYEIIRKYWPAAMAGNAPTWEEFNAEPREEQNRFFKWFKEQTEDVLNSERSNHE